ncbi:hypothetical protein ACFY9A_38050 [Streptomyces rubradiris]|uniref:hypothetical protein n=1 Tax=Streptomyces rubradiris TaxID=285531 RepID=UPI0036F0D162
MNDLVQEALAAPQPPPSPLSVALDEAAALIAAARGRSEPVTDLRQRLQDRLTTTLTQTWPGLPVLVSIHRHHTPASVPHDCILLTLLDHAGLGPDGPPLDGSTSPAITACRIQAGFPVHAVIRLPAYRLHLEADRGTLTVTGDADRLPLFTPDTVLVSPHHAAQVRRLLPGRPIAAVPAAIAMTLIALDRATSALHPPAAEDRAIPWDYTAGALVLHCKAGKVLSPDGHDLAHSRLQTHSGWLASSHVPAEDDLIQLMHPQP